MSKVLYLDFDGVLQHESVYTHPKRGIYIKEPGFSLFQWMPILDRLLEPHPEVAIVLSTSWVHSKSFNFAKARLSESLQRRVIGATFHKVYMQKEQFLLMSRGAQIASDVERRKPSFWFAIDDDEVGWPVWCRNNLIHTQGNLGLSEVNVQLEIKNRLANSDLISADYK
jgi:hypothetical protein